MSHTPKRALRVTRAKREHWHERNRGERRSAIPFLRPASVTKRAPWQDSEVRVNNWITPWDFAEPIDAGLIGAPYSSASISASGAAGGAEAVRMAFRYNTTYSPDWKPISKS